MRFVWALLLLLGLQFYLLAAENPNSSSSSTGTKPSNITVALDPSFRIGKVVDYVNDPDLIKDSDDRSLQFDRKYHEFGAITHAQKRAKRGHYFYVTWYSDQPSGAVVVRFQYRQVKTKNKVFTLQVPYSSVKGAQHTTFEVIGNAYAIQGLVNSWRVTIVRNGQVVAEKRSFIW